MHKHNSTTLMAANRKTMRFNFIIIKSSETEIHANLCRRSSGTPPITGRLTGRAELNKIRLRQIYAVNN